MSAKNKRKDSAQDIAGLICDRLEELPEEEQTARLQAIANIKIVDRRNNPKRASTPQNPRGFRRTAVPRRKRAHR